MAESVDSQGHARLRNDGEAVIDALANGWLAHDRAKYEDLSAVSEYQNYSPGETFAPIFIDLVGDVRGTVLDAGCCTGKGGLALHAHGFSVVLCDYTDANLIGAAKALPFSLIRTIWDTKALSRLGEFDYVFCCDVLEHLPREFTMLAVQALLSVTRRGAFFTIGLTPDSYGVWVGRPLHETVESFVWWRDRLREFGTLQDARDLGSSGLYYLAP